MTDNIFEFSKTNMALGALSDTIITLDVAIKNKRQIVVAEKKEKDNLLQEKEQKLASLKLVSENVISNIDNIINSLDKVLEENGSSNNNN